MDLGAIKVFLAYLWLVWFGCSFIQLAKMSQEVAPKGQDKKGIENDENHKVVHGFVPLEFEESFKKRVNEVFLFAMTD